MMEVSESTFYSTPVRVRWAGWDSDTYALRRHGWKIFAGERAMEMTRVKVVDLALTDPEEKIMIAGNFEIRAPEYLSRHMHLDGYFKLLMEQGVDMKMYRATDRMYVYQTPTTVFESYNSMSQVDGFAHLPTEERHAQEICYGELSLFRENKNGSEIFIPQGSVDKCLDLILQHQYKERRTERELKESAKPIAQAQVFSIAV